MVFDNTLSQRYRIFTSGSEWAPSLATEDGALHCTALGIVERDAAENFRGAEKGPRKRRQHSHRRNTGVKHSSKHFSLSGIHSELLPLLWRLQPLVRFHWVKLPPGSCKQLKCLLAPQRTRGHGWAHITRCPFPWTVAGTAQRYV